MAEMRMARMILTLLLALLSASAACPGRRGNRSRDFTRLDFNATAHLGNYASIPNSGSPSLLSKRWYSIWSLAEIQAGTSPHGNDVTQYDYGPWPKKCGQTWVRFCFKNAGAADRLLDIVAHGIVYWGAIIHSSHLWEPPDIL